MLLIDLDTFCDEYIKNNKNFIREIKLQKNQMRIK